MEVQVCGKSVSCAGVTEASPGAVCNGLEQLEPKRTEKNARARPDVGARGQLFGETPSSCAILLTQSEPSQRRCEHGNEQGDFSHSPTLRLSSESPEEATRSRWQTLYPSSACDTCCDNDRLSRCFEDNNFDIQSYNLHRRTSSPGDGDLLDTSVDAELQDWFQSVQSVADEEAQEVLSSWSKSRQVVNPDRDDFPSGLPPMSRAKNWSEAVSGNLSDLVDDGCFLSCKDKQDVANADKENVQHDSDVEITFTESLLQNVLDRVQAENVSCRDQPLRMKLNDCRSSFDDACDLIARPSLEQRGDLPQRTKGTQRPSRAESKEGPCLPKILQYRDDFESNAYSRDDVAIRSRRGRKAESIDSSTLIVAQEKGRGRIIHHNGSMKETVANSPQLSAKKIVTLAGVTTCVTETVAKIVPSERANNKKVKFTSMVKKHRLALMRTCFLGMSQFAAMEKRQLNQAADHIRLKHMRVPRMILRKWRELASSNIQREERIVKVRYWKQMRLIFSNWMDFGIKSSLNAKHMERQHILKRKADTMCRWKRRVRILVTQREQALETLQREEALRLETKACQWYRQNVLTSCILGWRAVAQTEKDQKALDERKQRRKDQVEKLLNRLSRDGLGGDRRSAVFDNVSTEAVTGLQMTSPSNGSTTSGQNIDPNIMALPNLFRQHFPTGKSIDNDHPDAARSPCSNVSSRFANRQTNKALQPTSNPRKPKERRSAKTRRCSGAKSGAEEAAEKMERRRQERIERRKDLHDRYLEKKRADEEMLRLEEIREQEEFQRSVDRERQGKINEQAEKRRAIELRREAWRLAGLHSRLSSMKRGIATWKSHLEHVHLRQQKALLFHRDRTEQKFLGAWILLWREQKKLRQEEDVRRLRRADEFRGAHVVGNAFRVWRRVADEAKSSDDALCLRHARRHTRRRIMRRWRERAEMERLRSWRAERSAGVFVRRFHLRRSLDAWRAGAAEAREGRRRDEGVAARWAEVRLWLRSPTED